MTKTLKIEDIEPGLRWGWVADINGMGAIADQKTQVDKFVKHPIHIFEKGIQTMHDAARNGDNKGPSCAMVVVGVRALGKAWGDAFELLGATGDYLYSISSNYLYDCKSTSDFNKAFKEYKQQVLIPARKALKDSGKKSGPKRLLDKDLLAVAALKRDSGATLPKIKADLLDQYDCGVSVPTLSRRLNELAEEKK